MHDVKALESEWKKYKSKKRKPYFITLFFIVCIVSILGILNKNKFNFTEITSSLNGFFKIYKPANPKNNKIILNIGLNSLEKKSYMKTTNIEVENTLVDIPVLNIENVDNILPSNNENSAKVYLDIFGTSSISAYEDVEKRFLQSHDIDDALFLAKSYYKRLNYKKAVYWSYEVNKIDETLEESVFIFVKSKVKLGQKNEGILLLKRYIKKSSSETGRILLNKIENDIL